MLKSSGGRVLGWGLGGGGEGRLLLVVGGVVSREEGLVGLVGGEVGLVGGGVGLVGGGGGVQHGPVQVGLLRLAAAFLRLVHLRCSQRLQSVQSTDVQRPSFVWHWGQM